ncbi:hypothetical protein OH76DRAFT_1443983 [Lentinus brumalis]|uniref:Uncharacterized protein n=1 Tax=Lentinus brumalis TaxID=2498619 RepID=A0A371CZV7_9APHY|nr:hypothetical protein OH76DRAFT_1443983 [Polyporus brumalis]
MSQMPWNILATETLKKVVGDLGLSDYIKSRRRADLEKLLQEISMDGLETIAQELKEGTYAANYPKSVAPPARTMSPELEYEGPPPRSVPVVEIPSSSRSRAPKAGPSRVRARARSEVSEVPASPPPLAKKLKVAPPCYAILYKQHQEIAPPSEQRHPLLNPHLKFDGVHIPPMRRPIRRNAPRPTEDSDEETRESASARRVNGGPNGAVSGRAGATTVVAGSSASPRRVQPVVVLSHLSSIKSSARRAGPSRNE